MCVILRQCRYLHVPKTGGTWVRRALRASCRHLAEIRRGHVILDDAPGRGLFTVAFVRHPWSWWRSYWAYKRTTGWDLHNPFDIRCMDNVFERFMLNVVEKSPGHCTHVYRKFVGSGANGIQCVGRFEHLVDDLVAALRDAGEPFDEDCLRGTRIANASNYKLFSTQCSAEIRQRVLDAEQDTLTRFHYSADA